MSRNSTHINCNQIAGTVNQGIWVNDCDPCAESPFQIPNITQWLRQKWAVTAAGTVHAGPIVTGDVANTAIISAWGDQIGTNHGVQGTAANQPAWNESDLSFSMDANDALDLTSVTYGVSDDFVIVLGMVPDNVPAFNTHALWTGDSNQEKVTITSSTTIEVELAGTAQTITGVTLAPQAECSVANIILRRTTGVCQFFVAGVAWGTPFAWAGDYKVDTIGLDGTNGLNGKIYTFMQFDRALTDKEIWCLDCYLCGGDDEPPSVGCRIDSMSLDCYGDSDGTLTATMTGATGTVTYLWSNAATTQTITGLSAGTYTCTMTDSGTTLSVVCSGDVSQPEQALSCAATAVQPFYVGGILQAGDITLTVTGGWGMPLTNSNVVWTLGGAPYTPSGGDYFNFPVLVAGLYAYTVTDPNNCTCTGNVTITIPGDPVLEITCASNDPDCYDDPVEWGIMMDPSTTFNTTASIVITNSSGTALSFSPLSLTALPASTTNFGTAGNWYLSGSTNVLPAGDTYTFVVSDTGSPVRTATCTTTVGNPEELAILSTVVQPTGCEGIDWSNGQLSFSVVGGTGAYTYSIEKTTATTGTIAANVWLNPGEGTYILKVVDANGCEATETVTITCPMNPMVTISHTTTQVSCTDSNGQSPCDGTATFTPSSTTSSGYTFTLEIYNAGGTLLQTVGPLGTFPAYTMSSLCAGPYYYTYTATLTSSGATTVLANAVTFNITQPSPLSITAVVTDTGCNGAATGAIDTTVSGGTSPFTYAWSTALPGVIPAGQEDDPDLTLLTAGTYVLDLSDANGCAIEISWTVEEPCPIDITMTAPDIDCEDDATAFEYVINHELNYGGSWTNDYGTQMDVLTNFLNPNDNDWIIYGPYGGLTNNWNWHGVVLGCENTWLKLLPDYGLFQTLHGLTIGNTYTVNVQLQSITSGATLDVNIYNGVAGSGTAPVIQGSSYAITAAGLATTTFVAQSTDPIINIHFDGVPASGSTGTWNQVLPSYPMNGQGIGSMGRGVAMSGDGKTLLGGGNHPGAGGTETWKLCTLGGSGSSTYPYAGSEWKRVNAIGYMNGNCGTGGTFQGDRENLMLSHDGLTMIIASQAQSFPCGAGGAASWAGGAEVNTWVETNASSCQGYWELKGQHFEGTPDDKLGAVAISADANVIAIGAPGKDSDTGEVKLYKWNSGGSTWDQIGATLTGAAQQDDFGNTVSLSDDGTEVAIGSIGHDSSKGTVQVWENQSLSGNWTQKGADIDGLAAEQFGFCVSISGDGTVVAGGSREYSNHKGVARVYTYAGSAWGQTGADIVGDQDDEHGATQIRLSTDGDVITIGSPYYDVPSTDKYNVGRVRTYDNVSGTWTQFGSDIVGSYANASGNELGFDVAMNQTGTMVVSGEPYVYGLNGLPGTQGWPGGMVVHERISTSNPATGVACLDYVSVTGMVVSANTTDITVQTGPCGQYPFTFFWTAPTATPQGVIPTGMSTNPYVLNDVICGTYTVLVTDDNGCTDTETLLIACAGSISNSITVTSDDDCSGECTGAAESDNTWSGASYLWTTDAAYTTPVTGGVGSTSYNITWQCPGTYYLRVTLDNGCVWEGSCVIGGGSANITLAAAVTDADMCDDCCGEILLTVSGTGQAPYTFLWDDPANSTTQDLTCIPAGTYTVIVTDANGCEETGTWTVNVSNWPIVFTLSLNGGSGQIDVIGFAGGTPTYTYQWTLNGVNFANGSTSTTVIPSLTPAGNGNYCLTVTDKLDCEETVCIDVNIRSSEKRYDCTPVVDDCSITQKCQDIIGPQPNENSGYSNDLSGDKTTVAVGSPHYSTTGGDPQEQESMAGRSAAVPPAAVVNRGAVRVYREVAEMKDCWEQIGQTLIGDHAYDEFGHSVSMSNDGNVLAVGAWMRDVEGNADAGRVYIYDYDSSSNSWVPRRFISGTAVEEYCGDWVSLSADGTKIALSSPGHLETSTLGGGATQVGRARMYSYSAPTWTQMGSDINGHSGVGPPEVIGFASKQSTVAFSNDGTTVVVGLENYGIPPAINGLARVYRYASSAWTQLGADLFSTNTVPGVANIEDMGQSVSISTDGNIVAISGPKSSSDLGTHNDQGLIVVWEYASSTWTQLGDNIWGDDAYDYLGAEFSVYLAGDGQSLVVGAPGHNNAEGYARVYKLISSVWTPVCDTIFGHQSKEEYGHSVSMSTDGSRVSVGGPYFSAGVYNSVGIVEVFDITYGGGTTAPELVTDGIDFTNVAANTHVTAVDTATVLPIVNAATLTAGAWYTFGPDGSATCCPLAPTPATSGGDVTLTKGNGIAQKITGLTVGQAYEIKVVTGSSACASGVGILQVFVGTTAGTIDPYNSLPTTMVGLLPGNLGYPTQYIATATHATIVIWDMSLILSSTGAYCDWDVINVSMKAQQTICVECDTSIDPTCGYATMPLCIAACDPSETFDCIEGRCIDPGDGSGTFATKQLCLDDGCEVRQQRWNCKVGIGCIGTYGAGTYASLSACQAACGISGELEDKYYCEILCPGTGKAIKYTDDGATEERVVKGKKYKSRKKEDAPAAGGGRCRVVLGTESPAIPADEQYVNLKACHAKCPWCKDSREYAL